MEITQQPSTIGEMSLEHFQTYITKIIKHVTDERFDIIEHRLDNLESDSIQTTNNIIELGNKMHELAKGTNNLKKGQQKTDENFEQIKDIFFASQNRFDRIESEQSRHARKLEELTA